MWALYAVLSAAFASLTAIFSKIGVRDVDSNLALALRVSFVLVLVWGIVLATGALKGIRAIPPNTFLFLFLSAVATGLSWLFFFKAPQLGTCPRWPPWTSSPWRSRSSSRSCSWESPPASGPSPAGFS